MKKIILFCLLACAFLGPVTVWAQSKKPVLNHIALYVKDLGKSAAFYETIIRIDTIPEPFHDGKHVWFNIGGHSQLHLIQGSGHILVPDKNTHLCFTVPSVDVMIKRLNAHHIDYTNWPGTAKAPTVRPDGVKQIYLQDPSGYWIEINDDRY